MKTKPVRQIPKGRGQPSFPRPPAVCLSTVILCLLGCLLTARGQDPWLTNTNYPMDTNASLGATVSFRVFANSTNPPMTIQWQHEGTNLPAATNFSLIIANLAAAHAGGYMAMISNASGGFTNSRTAILTVDTLFIKITQGPPATDAEGSTTVTWIDYDQDEWLDLFVGNAGNNVLNSLYRNNRDGSFTKITTNLLGSVAGSAWGIAWGDYDNDGRPDLYVANVGNRLPSVFHNEGGGRFTRVTTGPLVSTALDGMGALWGDFDSDGFIDLFASTGYWSGPQLDRLFHNERNGTFRITTATEVGPLVSDNANDLGIGCLDYDNDGDLDLFVSYISPPFNGPAVNYIFRNSLNGFFEKLPLPSFDIAAQCWGVSWGDYDNDGHPDVFLPSYTRTNALFRNLQGQGFTNVAAGAGLASAMASGNSAWGDYDNDGWLDLCVANYEGEPNYPGGQALFHNDRDGTFTRITTGSPAHDDGRTVGVAWGDYDNDGFLDLYIACGDASPQRNLFYRNNGLGSGNTNRWLKVKLTGQVSNRMGIGAKIRVLATIGGQSVWQLRTITGQHSWISDNGLIAHFGLGDATKADIVRVEWPSGNVQESVNVAPNQMLTRLEPILINPVRTTASLGDSVSLTNVTSGLSYQWRFDGVDLVGQTSRILTLTNLTADMAGRYSVVVSNATTLATNFTYLYVDPTFFKIMTGPVVTDRANSVNGSWADYDEDGFSDLFVPAGVDVSGQAPALYRNLGGTNFVNLTTNEVGQMVGRRPYCYQGLWADFDNDGNLDLLEIGDVPRSPIWASSNRFFLGHSDHTFEWITRDIGVNPPQADAWQCSLVDSDNDGAVDVYYTTGWVGPPATRDALYRNRGDGTFVPAWSPTGPIGNTQFGTWADYDNDRDRDLWLGSWNGLSQFYRNNGDGTFSTNLAGSEIPASTGFYGMWGDYDNDGFPDVLTTETLYHNNRNGGFSVAATFPLGFASWGDYDNDGDLDIVSSRSLEPSRFYRNEGGSVFTLVDLGSPSRDLSSAPCWCDYDNDGFLDLFVATRGNPNGANFLYRSSGLAGGNSNHWLIVKPRGTTSNRSAIGAKVRVQATIRGTVTWQLREIQGGQFDDLRAHFGLGNATNVTKLRVEWPSGTVQELSNVTADQILTITEPRRPVLVLDATPAGFTGTLKADTNQTYQVHASEDLAAGWTVLTNITTDATGTAYWSDSGLSPQGRRFYKAVKGP